MDLRNPATLSQTLNKAALTSPVLNTSLSENGHHTRKAYFFSFAFEALSVIGALLLGYFYFRYLTELGPFPPVIITGALFAVLSALAFLLSKSTTRRAFVLLFEVIALLFFFVNFPNLEWYYLVGIAAVVYFFLYWGERQSRNELENGLKFKFLKVMRPMLWKLVSALVLVGVLLSIPRLQQEQQFFSNSESFLDISGWTAQLIERFYPNYEKDTTLDAIAKKLAESQLERSPQFASLPAETRERAIQQMANEIIKNFSAQTGIQSTEGDSLQSAIYQFAANTLQGWYNRAPTFFLFIWAAILFFVVRSVAGVAALVIAGVAFLLYEVLIAMDVIHLTGESRLHEMIEYS